MGECVDSAFLMTLTFPSVNSHAVKPGMPRRVRQHRQALRQSQPVYRRTIRIPNSGSPTGSWSGAATKVAPPALPLNLTRNL